MKRFTYKRFKLLLKNIPLKIIFSLAIVISGLGLLFIAFIDFRNMVLASDSTIVITNMDNKMNRIVVEVLGEVKSPGIYELKSESRLFDAIYIAGGFTDDADVKWIEEKLHLTNHLLDGDKVYIPSVDNTFNRNSNINNNIVSVNKSSENELKELVGVGEVRAQKIIDNRPYQSLQELLNKKIVTEKIMEDNNDLISL